MNGSDLCIFMGLGGSMRVDRKRLKITYYLWVLGIGDGGGGGGYFFSRRRHST